MDLFLWLNFRTLLLIHYNVLLISILSIFVLEFTALFHQYNLEYKSNCVYKLMTTLI